MTPQKKKFTKLKLAQKKATSKEQICILSTMIQILYSEISEFLTH